jgi:uncharacterized protein (TIGR03437 family)
VSSTGFSVLLADGGLASIYGTGLAGTIVSAATLPLPVNLGGIQVLVNGVAAPLLYVSPTQINFQVPYGTPTGTPVPVVVVSSGTSSAPENVTLANAAPSVFTYERTPTSIDPVITHADNSLVTPLSPAQAGEVLQVYATGAGPLNNAPASGAGAPLTPPATTVSTPVVTVGGASASVQFSGLTPGLVGLWQINIQLPATLPATSGVPASLPLVISLLGASSSPVNLWVNP